MSELIPYDDRFEPTDYAEFESVEDRDELTDLWLEPCEQCGGILRALGAFALRVILDCEGCSRRFILELQKPEGDYWEEEDEEEED